MMNKRFKYFAFLLFLSASSVCVAAKPNLIFYLADDQDKLDYGCYGNELIHTPAVDRLAQEGMVFENAFTGQAICAPSRSQLFTGNYPLKNGCFMNHFRVKPDQVSISTRLRELGYEVILAGKSHVSPEEVFEWDIVWPAVKNSDGPRKYLPFEQIEEYFRTSDKPFCMFITSYYPHGPYFDVEGKTERDIKFYPYSEQRKKDAGQVAKMAGYYRSVQEDNAQLERILESVDKHLDDNTVFVYSADHGVSGKFTVYDRGLNVPFVVRWPRMIKPQSRSEVMIHYTDVLPTFIDLAEGEVPEEVDGKSFLPVLKGDENEIHSYVYGVRTSQNILAAKVFPSRMIRNNQFKYIRNLNASEVVDQNLGENPYVNSFIRIGASKYKDIPYEELYQISNDPFELNNLANDPRFSDIKKQLAVDLLKWMKDQGDVLSGEPGDMPILQAVYKLDQASKYNKVPEELENTLKKEDYLFLNY